MEKERRQYVAETLFSSAVDGTVPHIEGVLSRLVSVNNVEQLSRPIFMLLRASSTSLSALIVSTYVHLQWSPTTKIYTAAERKGTETAEEIRSSARVGCQRV